jgi:Zn-dependent protease with chaperone function
MSAVMESLYPPSVSGVPAELTVPNANYRRSVVIVFASLLLFLAFYLALVTATGWLLYTAVTYPIDRVGRGPILLKIGAVAISGMLFLFMVKGLFKRHSMEHDLHIELKEADYPELYQFIRQLCAETKAPFPHRIYASPEVNAAVFYNSTLLNLIFPTKKNLLIGLGLVNSLTLSEFKAVMAH